MAWVSLTKMDRNCPLSSKKTCLWPARFRSLTARALMCSVLPRSSSTCRKGVQTRGWRPRWESSPPALAIGSPHTGPWLLVPKGLASGLESFLLPKLVRLSNSRAKLQRSGAGGPGWSVDKQQSH